MATPLWMSHGSVCWRRVLPEGDDKIEEGPNWACRWQTLQKNGHFWYLFNPIYLIYLFKILFVLLCLSLWSKFPTSQPHKCCMFFGGTQNCGKLSYVQLMGCSRRVIYPLAPILTVNPSTNSETGESETAMGFIFVDQISDVLLVECSISEKCGYSLETLIHGCDLTSLHTFWVKMADSNITFRVIFIFTIHFLGDLLIWPYPFLSCRDSTGTKLD